MHRASRIEVAEPWGRFERHRSVAKVRREDDGTAPVAKRMDEFQPYKGREERGNHKELGYPGE
ncbi:MAG: hypothetical protein ACOYVK_10210 [Bacillota bacterium]